MKVRLRLSAHPLFYLMKATLYRRSLSYRSGAGQLIALQVQHLREANIDVDLHCQRGAFRFLLQAHIRSHRIPNEQLNRLESGPNHVLVDHGMELAQANIVFCHNLMSEAVLYLDQPELKFAAERDAHFFEVLRTDALIIANSPRVKTAISRNHRISSDRIHVCPPGIQSHIFNAITRAGYRSKARHNLGINNEVPLVGFVTSGDLHKRGLAIFLEAAEAIHKKDSRVRFLIVGSKQLPNWAMQHPIVRSGALQHRPRGKTPALWMSALDVFLYPARYEEFGMVVPEAAALGVPVLTSRRVGASEYLSSEFDSWLLDEPESMQFAELALGLLDDKNSQQVLSQAGISSMHSLTAGHYAARSEELIRAALSSC